MEESKVTPKAEAAIIAAAVIYSTFQPREGSKMRHDAYWNLVAAIKDGRDELLKVKELHERL
jgi:hypothetical protein